MEIADTALNQPERLAITKEQSQRINSALNLLPYEQQEIITLHLQGGLKFKEIAESQNVSVNTIQSRYRYGIDKLRTLLATENTEVTEEKK